MGFQLMVLAEAAAGFSTADRADSHLPPLSALAALVQVAIIGLCPR